MSVDQNGTPRVAAEAYYYLPTTTTPITLYTTDAYAVELTNPVESVSNGLFPAVHINPAVNPTYKLVLKDADGATIYTEDNLATENSSLRTDLSGDDGASLVGTSNGGTVQDAIDYGLRDAWQRGDFTLPATLKFFGDSFWEQPNSHTTSTDSMAQKAAVLLGKSATISATSGNTSVDKQAAIYAANPAASDCWLVGLGQNDAQFVGTGSDRERRINDIGLIHLANHFQMGVPSGSRRYLANAAVSAGSWANDTDIAEGGALVSTTNASALQFTVTDTRFVVVIFKLKATSGGKFNVIIDGTPMTNPFDAAGYHSAPFGNIPSNTGQNYARAALVYDLGRRKPTAVVQAAVTSATNAANPVSICQVMGLSGAPLAGPLVGICDLTDRNTLGWATAGGSQASVPIVSRLIMQSLAIAGSCGLRVVPIPLSTAINNTTHLDTDEFHPNESGAIAGAQAIATAIQAAARDWSVSRPDLDTQSLAFGATGYALALKMPITMGPLGHPTREKLSPRMVDFRASDPILCPDSIRIVFDDLSGSFDLSYALYLAREAGDAGIAYTGNLGAGAYALVAYGATRLTITTSGIVGSATHALVGYNNNVVQLGAAGTLFTDGFFTKVTTPATTVASLPTAASNADRRMFVSDANATTFASVVAGGGANRVPVYCDGTNWRIG
jgi:hypothetical protein